MFFRKQPQVSTDVTRVDETLSRGVSEIIVYDDLRSKLLSGSRLRIKLGIDPTSPHLHIGRAVAMLKLRDFQELGHQIVLIVGDFTGVIGDTSDKDSERPMLSSVDIETNKKTYLDQVGKLLDLKQVEFLHNSEWLQDLRYGEISVHADQFSVAEFIARENIKKRIDAGKRVSLREILYPLMQGYDSVAVRADVEVGGIDQKFNLLAGRTLQSHAGQIPQNIVMNPLISGLDGRKMSSSWGNTINLTAEPADMYGKIMSMADSEIIQYFELCTRVPMGDVKHIGVELSAGGNPRDAKMRLAREIVALYHGIDSARAAEKAFIATFQQKKIPSGITEVPRTKGGYADSLVGAGVVASKSELARLMDGGGIKNADTGEKMTLLPERISEPITLKVGKRRFVRLLP